MVLYSNEGMLSNYITNLENYIMLTRSPEYRYGLFETIMAEYQYYTGNWHDAEVTVLQGCEKAKCQPLYGVLTSAVFLNAKLMLLNGKHFYIKKLFQSLRTLTAPAFRLSVELCEMYFAVWSGDLHGIPEWIKTGEFPDATDTELVAIKLVHVSVRLMMGQYAEAIVSAESYLNQPPSVLFQLYMRIFLAIAYDKRRETDTARIHLRAAFALRPQTVSLCRLLNLGRK